MASPISRALDELVTERDNLRARLEKIEGLIAQMRDVFHLRGESTRARPRRKGRSLPAATEGRHARVNGTAVSIEAVRGALQHGPIGPGKLAEHLGVARANMRYHLALFEEQGLVVCTGTTTQRRIALPGKARAAKEAP